MTDPHTSDAASPSQATSGLAAEGPLGALVQSGTINLGPNARIERGDIVGGDKITYIIYTGPDRPVEPEARRDLEQAYRSEVVLRWIEWTTRYAPLAMHAAGRARRSVVTRLCEVEDQLIKTHLRRSQANGEAAVEQRTFTDLREGLRHYGDLLLLGPPGGGKTTALWRLALDLALEGLEQPDRPLPVFVRLGGLREGQELRDLLHSGLERAALTDLEGRTFPLKAHRRLAPLLTALLKDGRLVLLWDGLNETPRAIFTAAARELETFRSWSAEQQNASIITSRADDYDLLVEACGGKDPLPIARATVEALDPVMVREMVLRRLEQARGAALLEALERPEHRALAELARTPLLLTMLCEVYDDRGTLPTNRGRLLADFVATRFAWEERRHPDTWIEATAQEKALARLAFDLTKSRGRGTMVERAWAEQRLLAAAPEASCERLVSLARQADLLEVLDGGETLRFSHQLVQEFFAALALREKLAGAKKRRDAGGLSGWFGQWQLARYASPDRRTGWEETLLLLAGLDGEHSLAQELIRAFLGDPVRAARVALASDRALSPELQAEITGELERMFRDPKLPVEQRIEAGSAYSTLQYGAQPVTVAEWQRELARRNERFGAPDGYFCYVRPGTYRIGGWDKSEASTEIALPGFWIARFPITVAQFAPFVAEGYGPDAKPWWTPEGWQWKQNGKRTEPWGWSDANYRGTNQPVIGVTWFEARAYCAWLTVRLAGALPSGLVLRIPTEVEWEAAAAYDGAGQRLPYPWGDEPPSGERAVFSEGKLDRPAPVGCCPAGAAACGALDMAGNVWEVTTSSYGAYPDRSDQGKERFTSDTYDVPCRGGYYSSNETSVRCGARGGFIPDFNWFNLDVGLRVVLAPPLAG